jgi:hypothetical protein
MKQLAILTALFFVGSASAQYAKPDAWTPGSSVYTPVYSVKDT